MEISERLKSVVEEIEYRTLADIGTDHAYVPIYGIINGVVERAIACDIKKGPLKKATENVKRYGLEDKIDTRLGAGLDPLCAGEVETVVISGMGGLLINEILEKGLEGMGVRQLILQPQLDIGETRKFLRKINFGIRDEAIVLEEGKFYFILNCHQGENMNYNDTEYMFSQALIRKKDPVYKLYIERQLEKIQQIMGNSLPEKRAAELTKDKKEFMEVLKCL